MPRLFLGTELAWEIYSAARTPYHSLEVALGNEVTFISPRQLIEEDGQAGESYII